MTILGLPATEFAALAAYAIVYLTCVLSPPLFAGVIAWRRGAQMPKRLAFVATVTIMAYGLLLFVLAVLGIPINAFLVYVVPMLRQMGYFENSLFLAVANFASSWSFVIVPLVFLAVTICILRYLTTRWSNIATALDA
jgi:hypothetical protein